MENTVYGLDIGTRSIVGILGYMDKSGFHVTAMEVKEHETRAMLDGQVHDIATVGEEIKEVTAKLEKKSGLKLKSVCIAAAGRVLQTVTVKASISFEEEKRVTNEDIYNLGLAGVELAHHKINKKESREKYYCVGSTPVKYYLNGYVMGNLEGHKADSISVDLLATFLPDEVVDGLYSAVEYAGLDVSNLTLEPIAAMNVAIPEQYRLLNIALVDVGAGTSDICITKDGSVVAYGMIPSAGDEISEIIAKNYLIDFRTADNIKIESSTKKSVTFKDIMGLKQTVLSSEIHKLAAPVTDKITKKVAKKILDVNGGKPVSAVFVVGGGGKIPGFTKSLAKALEIPQTRVAVRGKEVLENVEFAIDNFEKDSLFVTPVGICVTYFLQKNNFIYVTVNSERIKLYDNEHLTIIDALMQAGFPNEKLFPRRGKEIKYTVNGQTRMVRGLSGEPAKIYKNGKEANMNMPIDKNDIIDVEESTAGESQTICIRDIPEYKGQMNLLVNDINISCPKFAYVNGKIVSDDYSVKNGDKVVMENYYTVAQLFEFLDVNTEDVSITVNNETAFDDTKVYENFSVKYESFVPGDEQEEAVKQIKITVKINGQDVELSGKSNYIFVDIFDFYPFDRTQGKGNLITLLNNTKADYMGEIMDGDEIELRWENN